MISKNYEMTAGDTLQFGFVLKDADNLPVDFTGGSAVFTMRETLYGSVLVTKSISTDSTGELDFQLDPNDTLTLITEGAYKYFVYDVEITDSNGNVTTIASGIFKINQGVTR